LSLYNLDMSNLQKYMDEHLSNIVLKEETPSAEFIKEVGRTLAKKRKEMNISQKELSKRSGIAQPVISSMENGGTNPTLSQLFKYVSGLGVAIKVEVN